MSKYELIAFVVFFVTIGTTITTITQAYFKSRQRDGKEVKERALAPGTEERLARIEQAVDAIAIEVERMSEAQRFTTKLLAERAREDAVVPGAASRTEGARHG